MIKYTKFIVVLLVLSIVSSVVISYRRDIIGKTKEETEEGVEVQSNGILDETFTSGLLLGFRKDGEDSSSYRTLWIACKDNKLQVLSSSDSIIMPYANKEFIQFSPNEKVLKDNKGKISYITWGSLGGQENTINYNISEDNETHLDLKLNYVGNRYINYTEKFTENYDKGYYKSNVTYVTDYSMISKGEEFRNGNINIKEIDNSDNINKIIEQKVDKEYEDKKYNLKDGDILADTTDGSQWSIERYNGHWIGKVASTLIKTTFYDSKIWEGSYSLIKGNVALPSIVVPYDELTFSYDVLKSKFPDAIDAFTSPTNDLLLIVTKTKLRFYQITDSITGFPQILDQPILEIDKSKEEKIIMNHWATYDFVNQWTETLNKYLSVP